MSPTADPPHQRNTTATLLSVAFCEACERLVSVRALLDDPRLETRRQGSAVVAVLREGLRSVEAQLREVRPGVFASQPAEPASTTLAGIGVAVAGLRRLHTHLGYLGTRWPLGTADLFVRKLVAEGLALPVPTLCAIDRDDRETGEVGRALRQGLREVGLRLDEVSSETPILALPTMHLLDPLTWATLLYDLATAMAARPQPAPQASLPGGQDAGAIRRYCRSAALAARLVGEPTYAACAVHTLIGHLGGGLGMGGLRALLRCTAPYGLPVEEHTPESLSAFFAGLLQTQAGLGGGWGRVEEPPEVTDTAEDAAWQEAQGWAQAAVPPPLLPDPQAVALLYEALCDGRPINAHPPALPPDFRRQLAQGLDAERFYAVLGQADERPCSLATILTVGWHYKLRRSYALCRELMAGPERWEAALERLAAHVLERCALLQQSMEAAYVQQIFSRWRDP